jgi:hypothetical protein
MPKDERADIVITMPEQYAPCLLIEGVTGVTYRVQAGGRACALVERMGYLVPLYLYDATRVQTLTENKYVCPGSLAEQPRSWVADLEHALLEGEICPPGDITGLRMSAVAWGEGYLPVTTVHGDGYLIWS